MSTAKRITGQVTNLKKRTTHGWGLVVANDDNKPPQAEGLKQTHSDNDWSPHEIYYVEEPNTIFTGIDEYGFIQFTRQ